MDPTTEILMRAAGTVHKESIPYWVTLFTQGTATTKITEFVVSKSGDVFVLGQGTNAYVARIDNSGSAVWCNHIDGFSSVSIAVDASDNVYVAGFFAAESGTPTSIIKYDSSGVQQWAKSYRPQNRKHGGNQRALTIDASGFLYISGYTSKDTVTGTTPLKYVIKIDPSGVVSWARHTTTDDKDPNLSIGAPQRLYVDDTTNDVFLMSTGQDGTQGTTIFTKFDRNGALVWQKKFPSGAPSTMTVGGGFLYVSFSSLDTSDTSNFGSYDIVVTKFNLNGVTQWQKSIGSSGADTKTRLITNAAGDLFVLGEMNGSEKMVVARFNSSGTMQWQRALDKGSKGYVGAIRLFPNGDLCVGGWGTAPEAIFARLPADGSKAGTYNGVRYAASAYLEKARNLAPIDFPTTVQALTVDVADLTPVSAPDVLTYTVTPIP
jgi:hypothetical protein